MNSQFSKLLKKAANMGLTLIFLVSTLSLSTAAMPGYTFQVGSTAGLVPATEVLFSEDFSTTTQTVAGSTWGTAPNTLNVVKNETTATITDGSLSVVGTADTNKSLQLKSTTAITGKFTVEFNFKIVGDAAIPLLFGAGYTDGTTETTAIEIGLEAFATSDRFYRNLLYKDSSGGQNPLVDQTSSWRTLMDFHKWYILHGDGDTWSPYSRDWYTARVVIDTTSSTYGVYLNGSLCLKNKSFVSYSHNWNSTGINIPFMMTTSNSDAVKYDSIKIYREPVGRETLYANDFDSYDEEISWRGATSYQTQRLSLFAGVAGLGLANMQSKGGNIYARDNALVTEYRDGVGGAFPGFIRMDDDMTIDMDFTVDSFTNDSYLDNYATVLALTPVGADGIRFSVSKDGKFIYYYYNRTIPYEPTILTNITMDEPHHMTVYMNFKTYTCDLYIDGVLIAKNQNLMYNMGKKGTTEYYKNGEDMTIGLGYHKESPTTNVTYDNLKIYRDKREEVFSAVAKDVLSRFSGTSVVKGEIQLPSSISGLEGYNVKWKSNSSIISIANDGYSATVTPKEEDQVVKLTAMVADTGSEYTAARTYNVVVTADDSITDISSLEDWKVVEGAPLLVNNPTNEADKTVEVVAASEAYTTSGSWSGEAEATVQLYTDSETSGCVYLADDSGNTFATVYLDKSVLSTGGSGIMASCSYPSKKWFTLKVNADMLKRSYDVYVDGEKINNASIPFDYNVADDNATLARVGFSCNEGSIYVNDVASKTIDSNDGLEVRKIAYTNASGNAVNAPSAGGKVSYVEISNTLSSQSAVVFAAVYDDNGAMIDAGWTAIANLSKGVTKVDIIGVDIPTAWNDNYEVKAFVWSDTAKLVPLTDTHGENLLPTVYIAGDSTVADYGAEAYPYTGWGTEFKSLIDENINVVNMALADCSTAEFISGGQLDEIGKRILPGDYIFISAAYDDAAQEISEDTYKANLKTIASTATQNGAKVVFVTSPAAVSNELSSYAAYMKSVATELNAPVLDLGTAWGEFLTATDDDATYYGKDVDSAMKSDSRWELSSLNPSSNSYNASLAGKDGRLSPAGAQKAATLLASALKSAGLPISSYVVSNEAFTYSVASGVLTVNGSGDMPVYASFSETPWASATGVTIVKLSEGITSVSTDAFSGFSDLKEVYLPDSVVKLGKDAFPTCGNFILYGSNNTVGQRYAENDSSIDFAFKTFRILAIGNSHTHDYMNWRDLVFADLKNAGLKTEIEFDYIIIGGAQLYYKDIPYVGVEGEYRSHYTQGSNPNRAYYNTYTKLRDNTYDVVLIQDYRESVMDAYKYTFANDLTKVVRWIRNEQPNADVAWVSDWTDMNSTGSRSLLLTQWQTNSVAVMDSVDELAEDGPDFIVPMSTAIQNARTSYLGSVYNAADCYGDNSNADWNGTDGITNFTILERDGTHCSYELGRYLVSATVFGKVFDVYKDSMEGFDFDFFDVLSTTPEYVTNDIYPWNGSMTNNHMAIVRECAKNALSTPKAVTQSEYTVDPADSVATSVAGLTYSTFTAAGIASTVNSANLGITISESDVTINGNSATVTFLHGYTKKTVTISQ